ncbi:pyridoxamine 5'-phosphate oxidase family protein [Mycolicibacterium brumae]|uniref:Pyridoxamine 5'-phosphate oxidase family protein n=1 Tax=Mycolicibacterium brumae TaxID=85968 RepID=A0A2G5PGN8_9MYCO|nr:pyridoxamine 5'-phosphate oxidase family protein [Mycolicibacterium brumae]MCV7192528.1 pyridoxamine 5'-phosphate oxidase family protein [Mycolicibacterium brumae]PIB77476.1 pyridoxamine 5'-phosphate oxidase family protein [Mycolicibacterium brumae]RWA18480.1 hypothetical protein MBRU_04490 [Mycolicibacterium brumae DSM 44177]UWW10297.1 pyridoxamine 5'-phosphate oxidase family protein [Mycolicibacterium brumae]
MSSVDLDRLTAALPDFDQAFLVTVGDDGRPHVVEVDPMFTAGAFDVGAVGGHTAANLADRPNVTLLWPAREPGGYALMVDGLAQANPASTVVVPTKALLHRRGADGSPDCVIFRT